MKGFPAVWTTGNEELYAINKLFPTAEALAEAPENGKQHTCIWTNTYGQGRVFGTTVGHNNKTMSDPIYLDLLTRGLLWSVGQLDDERPAQGRATPRRSDVGSETTMTVERLVSTRGRRRSGPAWTCRGGCRTVFRSREFSSVSSTIRATSGSSTSR